MLSRFLIIFTVLAALSGCMSTIHAIVEAIPIGDVVVNSQVSSPTPFKISSLMIVSNRTIRGEETKPIPHATFLTSSNLRDVIKAKNVSVAEMSLSLNELPNAFQGSASFVPSHILIFSFTRAKISEDQRTKNAVMLDATLKAAVYDSKTRLVVWNFEAQTVVWPFHRNPEFGNLIFQQILKDGLI